MTKTAEDDPNQWWEDVFTLGERADMIRRWHEVTEAHATSEHTPYAIGPFPMFPDGAETVLQEMLRWLEEHSETSEVVTEWVEIIVYEVWDALRNDGAHVSQETVDGINRLMFGEDDDEDEY